MRSNLLQVDVKRPSKYRSAFRSFKSSYHASSLLGGELLTERCRTDDLMPDLPVPSLPPCRMDPKVLGLDVLIDRSEPGGSWASNGSPPVRWRTQSGGDETVMSPCYHAVLL